MFKLIVVEDNEEELDICRDTINQYKNENKCEIDLIECKNLKDALDKIDSSFDGAIIDLNLEDKACEGNVIIKKVQEANLRIPVIILTGTPDAVDIDLMYVKFFKKGEEGSDYWNLMDFFFKIYKTGLTKIMGGRGTIEDTLNHVLKENLIPYISKWTEYAVTDSSRTEKALLRHVLTHLFQLFDEDSDEYYPEEFYINNSSNNSMLQTGHIVKERGSGKEGVFVVMNPPCDIAMHGGECNTDTILLVQMDFPEKFREEEKKNKTLCYHRFPEVEYFKGGLLNFRKLKTVPKDKYNDEAFEDLKIQIAPLFVKNILGRFTAYYSRQGQPDIKY